MDPLSDVLRSVHLQGATFRHAAFTAPWCISGRYGIANVRERIPDADHVVFFHFIVAGSCKVRLIEGGDPVDLIAGDLVMFPQDDGHLMGSDLHLAPMRAAIAARDALGESEFGTLNLGGGGPATRVVCSYLACNRNLLRPLIEGLPRMVRIPMGEGPATGLVRELLRAGVRESAMARPGSASALAKLAELLFVEAMRCYAEMLPPGDAGWLAGLRDRHIGRALALLHGSPEEAWTVEALARRVALSRSALAQRFTEMVGEPPMQYLARWRLALAARQLRAGRESISRISERSGYESETAFSRAFKREFGVPPAAWRKARGALGLPTFEPAQMEQP